VPAFAILMFGALSAGFAFTAHVQTPGGSPIAGVAVTFANFDTTAYSDAYGDVSFTHIMAVIPGGKAPSPASLRMTGRNILVYLPASGPVDLRLYTLSGRTVFLQSKIFERGSHTFALPVMAKGIYILKAGIGVKSFVLKVNLLAGCRWLGAPAGNSAAVRLGKTTASTDTAFFAKAGYVSTKRLFATYDDSLGVVVMDSTTDGTLVKAVAVGGNFTMIVKQDATLWAVGDNTYGQLGDGTTISKSSPVQVMSGIAAVSAGGYYTMILKQDGTLWATGWNFEGELGDGTIICKSTPVQIMSGVSAVSAGGDHTLIIKQDGSLWATGKNNYGQLGTGDTIGKLTPIQIMSGVSAVSAGGEHALIIKQDGSLWATGYNRYGQLGTGDTIGKLTPVQIMSGVSSVSAGDAYTMIIKQDGTLWATGYNVMCELGDGTRLSKLTPEQVMSNVLSVSTGNGTMILKQDHSLWATGFNSNGQLGWGGTGTAQTPIQVMSGVSAVSNVIAHTMILKQDGTLWATGSNQDGELGDGKAEDKVFIPKQVIPPQYFGLTVSGGTGSGSYSSQIQISIAANDSSKAHRAFDHWGGPDSAQLSNYSSNKTTFLMPNKPALITAVYHNIPYLTVINGTGSGWYDIGKITFITANDSTASNRGFWHWGGPDSAIVGSASSGTTSIIMPSRDATVTAIYGDFFNLSVDGGRGSGRCVAGRLISIEANDSSSVKKAFDHWSGPDGALVENDTLGSTVFLMPSRDASVKAVFNTGYAVTYDKNDGTSDASPTRSALISAGRRIMSLPFPPARTGYVFAGWNRNKDGSGTQFTDTSIVAADITVYAQWDNVFKAVSAGGSYSMVVGNKGSLSAMGYNASGQLGDGTVVSKSAPILVMTDVSAVSTGTSHTMILKRDGTLWAAGSNSEGQLGNGTTVEIHTPVQVMSGVSAVFTGYYHTMILKQDQTLWAAGWNGYSQLGDGTKTNRSTPVQVMSGVAAVSAGNAHTVILKLDSTLWVAGVNDFGELGTGDTASKPTPFHLMNGISAASAGWDFTMILKADGTLWATGRNKYGQLGTGDTINRSVPVKVMDDVSAVSTGNTHTMILKKDGTLWATGYNVGAELGVGDLLNRSTPVPVTGNVLAVSAGGSHTMILKKDGSVWATGDNSFGQLGDGTKFKKSTPVQVMPLP
jgi:uncharacterized repeat protein (TIGR02543 family)